MLADPQGQIRLKEAWPETRWPEEIESSVAPRPVVFPNQNVPCMSMDHGMKLVDAWMAEKQDRAFDDAPRPVEFPSRNVPRMSMDHGMKLVNAWMAGRQDRAFDDALGINSGPERQKRRYEEVDGDAAPRQVKFPRNGKKNRDLRLENGFLADWRGQTPLATGVWDDQVHNIASHHGMTPARCISQQEQELACRAAVAKPESQAPGVAVNGVALRLPLLKLPSDNQGATASGSHLQKILNEVSAGTNQMAEPKAAYMLRNIYADSEQKASKAAPKSRGIRPNPTASRRADKPVQEIRCSECTESEGKPVTFKCVRSLQRHLTGTKKHNARPILRCSCGTVVVRKDAMHSHRNFCKEGTIVPLEA